MKSPVDITDEIRKLRTIIPKVNSSNTENIKAQLDILQNKIDDVDDHADKNWWNSNMRHFATKASEWLFEEVNESPSEAWGKVFK